MSPAGYGEDGYGEGEYSGGTDENGDGGDEPAPEQAPFGGEPHTIPGRIETEHFDVGGEGVAYHETDPPADWSLDYRAETGVDFKRAPGTEDGISVGRFKAEEWLEYTVAVDPGTYDVRVRCGTARDGRQLDLSLGGASVATVDVPVTGWSSHDIVTVSGVSIGGEAGERVLRLSPTADGVDVDWLAFDLVEEPDPEPEPEPEPESEPEPTVEHTTVTIDHGAGTDRVALLGQAPDAVVADVTGGVDPDPTLILGDRPQCAGATGDADRCSRTLTLADVLGGARTCWQHSADDIPEDGW